MEPTYDAIWRVNRLHPLQGFQHSSIDFARPQIMSRRHELIAVFEEARRLILLPGNDFSWSGWEDADDAEREINGVLDRLRDGSGDGGTIYFLPTGPLQELSLSSGWGDEFVALADRFDAAYALPAEEPNPACGCRVHPSTNLEIYKDLGMDEEFSEVTLSRCPLCGQVWLRYFHENEGLSCSGRWYLGAISEAEAAALTAGRAKSVLERLPTYFYGGSRFGGRIGDTSGPIR